MIILDQVEKQMGVDTNGKRILKVSLEADTVAEVEAIGTNPATVQGMPADTVIAPFSSCFTATQELGILGSDGNWNFGSSDADDTDDNDD